MSFVPKNDLERLLMAAPSDPAVRPDFYRALLEHELLLATDPTQPPPLLPDGTLQPGGKLSVRMLNNQGKPHAPIFSSPERMEAIAPPEGMPYVAMKGSELFALLKECDIVLNPGSEFGKVFLPQEVAAIVDGSIFSRLANTESAGVGGHRQLDVGGRRILLGQPADYPHPLIEGLQRHFATVPDVQAAYLAHGSIEGDNPTPHSIIGIELDGDWDVFMSTIGDVLQGLTKPDEYVDLVRLQPRNRGNDVIGDYMRRHTKPFYERPRRKKFLGLF